MQRQLEAARKEMLRERDRQVTDMLAKVNEQCNVHIYALAFTHAFHLHTLWRSISKHRLLHIHAHVRNAARAWI